MTGRSGRRLPRPLRMQRIALVAPRDRLPAVLSRVAAAGCVELDLPAGDRARGRGPSPADGPPDLPEVIAAAVGPEQVAGVVGWVPADALGPLSGLLAPLGGTAVPLPTPRWLQPPTVLPPRGPGRSFDVLVETYATVPYADLDPSLAAGVAYAVMFGIMFGDAGHGALLVLGALLLRSGRVPFGWAARVRRVWPLLLWGGAVSIVTGLLYGELFGPTGVLPVLWLEPLEQPVPMLLAAIGAGAVLLAGACALGLANRVREGGWGYALYTPTGVAGALLFLGLALFAVGALTGTDGLGVVGGLAAAAALGLAFTGLLAASGGGVAGVFQSVVELVDLVIRLGANLVSFARLAAFGLTHAALGALVWQATTALWGPGVRLLGAVAVFVVGNAVAFGLELLVAGIQALRLEYYELFSHVFAAEGRRFHPWRLPTAAVPTAGAGDPEMKR